MDKKDIDKKEEKERLEYLFNMISGLKGINVTFMPKNYSRDTPSSVIEKKAITLEEGKDYNKNKSEGLGELGHIWLSGSIREYYNNWNAEKYGDFNSFKWIVNVLEDIRTENLLSARYPQIKNRLVNLHIDTLNKFLEKVPNPIAKDPRTALYIAAENRFEMPIKIDKEVQDVSEKIKSTLDKSEFRDGNWKNMISAALKVSEEITKWEKEKFEDLMKMLSEIEMKINFLQHQQAYTEKEEVSERKELNIKQNQIPYSEGMVKELERQQKELELLKSSKEASKLKERIEKELKRLGEWQKETSDKIEKDKKDVEDILDHIEKLSKENEERYKEEYVPAVIERTRISSEITKRKAELKRNFEELPVTFQHGFAHEIKAGKKDGSKLTKGHMIALLEKSLKEREENEEEIIPGGNPRDKRGREDGKEISVVKVGISDKFVHEGIYPIPNLPLALADGYEIASELKRKLKLESVTLKKRLYGDIDMKAVKRQIARFNQIVNPRVMKIKKELIEKHSVLVLTDLSGSMGSGTENSNYCKVQWAKQALVTLGKTLESLNVNYSLRGFSTEGSYRISDIVLKDFSDPHMDYIHINKVFYTPNGGENRDGASIRHATKVLEQQRGKKMLIVISDGLPSHGVYGGIQGQEDTKRAIEEAENKGVHIMGISIDRNANNFVLEAYPNSFVFNDMNELPQQITRSYIQAMMRGV